MFRIFTVNSSKCKKNGKRIRNANNDTNKKVQNDKLGYIELVYDAANVNTLEADTVTITKTLTQRAHIYEHERKLTAQKDL